MRIIFRILSAFVVLFFSLFIKEIKSNGFCPISWLYASSTCWFGVLAATAAQSHATLPLQWNRLLRLFTLGALANISFARYLSQDSNFTGWEDVFFFCGDDYRYCTSGFHWNLAGLQKAIVLWSFVMSSAVGARELILLIGVGPLYPEEGVPLSDTMLCVVWRLLPYWLNNWERRWGAECSSLLFEVQHFATELGLILPCVQVLTARLKLLAFIQPVQGMPIALRRVAEPDAVTIDHVPDFLRLRLLYSPLDRWLLGRLKRNSRILWAVTAVTCLALLNALVVPVTLEGRISSSHRADAIMGMHTELDFLSRLSETRKEDTVIAKQENVSSSSSGSSFIPWPHERDGSTSEKTQESDDAKASVELSKVLSDIGILAQDGKSERLSRIAFSVAAVQSSDEAKVALWSLLWQPLLPISWLKAVLSTPLEGADMNVLSAFQYIEQPDSPSLAEAVVEGAKVLGRKTTEEQMIQYLVRAAQSEKAALIAGKAKADVIITPFECSLLAYLAKKGGINTQKPLQLRASAHPDDERIVWLRKRQNAYLLDGQVDTTTVPLVRALHRHSVEIKAMRDAERRSHLPLIEVGLSIMRLTHEGWWGMITLFAFYIAFRDIPAQYGVAYVKAVSLLTSCFHTTVLLAFPAVCWAYGAGAAFSCLVSVMFWSRPLLLIHHILKDRSGVVHPRHWRSATEEEMKQADTCAICWGALTEEEEEEEEEEEGGSNEYNDAGEEEKDVAMSLPCCHCFHAHCLQQWAHQCWTTSQTPKCPMCQSAFEIKVELKRIGLRQLVKGLARRRAVQRPREPARQMAHLVEYVLATDLFSDAMGGGGVHVQEQIPLGEFFQPVNQ